jgi:hypothetical protein
VLNVGMVEEQTKDVNGYHPCSISLTSSLALLENNYECMIAYIALHVMASIM